MYLIPPMRVRTKADRHALDAANTGFRREIRPHDSGSVTVAAFLVALVALLVLAVIYGT